MKKTLALIFVVGLVALVGCNREAPQDQAESEVAQAVTSVESGDTRAQVTSVAELVGNAVSVEYLAKGAWVSADIDSAEGEAFTDSLLALFPEQFGEVAAAYLPEEIVIKFHFKETAQYSVDVSSSATFAKGVEISTIEIGSNGAVFLMPHGVALGAIKNVETILPAAN